MVYHLTFLKSLSDARIALEKKYEKMHERWKHGQRQNVEIKIILKEILHSLLSFTIAIYRMQPEQDQKIARLYLNDLKFALHSKRVMMTAFDYKLRYLYGKCVENGELIPSTIISARHLLRIDIEKLLRNICAEDILSETMACFKRIYDHTRETEDMDLQAIILGYRYLPLCILFAVVL